jgi:hypothetical protein
MSKLLSLGVLVVGLVNAVPSFASCEDGEAMASDAATEAAQHLRLGCRLTKISDPKTTSLGETYVASFRCKSQTIEFRVFLQEIEDAVCTVSSVKRLRKSTTPESEEKGGKVTCPPPGTTINCMPITTNPYCVRATRHYVQAHCPGVSFLD